MKPYDYAKECTLIGHCFVCGAEMWKGPDGRIFTDQDSDDHVCVAITSNQEED